MRRVEHLNVHSLEELDLPTQQKLQSLRMTLSNSKSTLLSAFSKDDPIIIEGTDSEEDSSENDGCFRHSLSKEQERFMVVQSTNVYTVEKALWALRENPKKSGTVQNVLFTILGGIVVDSIQRKIKRKKRIVQ